MKRTQSRRRRKELTRSREAEPSGGRSVHEPTPQGHVRPEVQATGRNIRKVITGHLGTMTPIKQQDCWAQAQDVLLSHPRPQPSYLLNGIPTQQDLAGQA